MKNKFIIITIAVVIIAFIAGFVIPKETKPSASTRIILEHQYQAYIAPKCFDQEDVTNYLEDSTLGNAEELHYDAFDTCTENELAPEQDSLWISLLKDIGIMQKKWDQW